MTGFKQLLPGSLAEFVKFPCERTVAQRDISATKKFAGYNE